METAKLLIDGYFDHRTADNYHLTVDDLLDFPKEDQVMNDAFFAGNSSNSSPYGVDSSNFSGSGSDPQFSGNFSSDNHFPSELCIPYDDLGDLDWIPNFATDDFHSLGVMTGADTSSSETGHEIHDTLTAHTSVYGSYVSVPTKSRSKFSRAAPREWSSRLQVFSSASTAATTKKETGGAAGRKCLHCGSEKTPQWRAGPMGPKTLCNACGVRYNSGRLVPEYRPAASPTFVPEKHSNSHRKVVELRRQMEEKRYYRRQ